MFGISKIYLYAAAVVAFTLLLGGVYLKGRAEGIQSEKDRQAVAIAKATEQARATEAADRAERDARETSYLRRIRELESDNARPVLPQPVRLCRTGPSVSRAPNPAPSTDAAGSTRQPDVQAGEDLGPALRDYGRLCESLRIQLDELQKFIVATGPDS